MIIATKNAGGRAIPRVSRPTGDLDWYYTSMSGHRALAIRLDGSDGKSYTTTLSVDDLAALDRARERYADLLAGRPSTHKAVL